MSQRPIGIHCPTCLGRTCTHAGIPCAACQATGWIIKPLDELTPEQARSVREEIAEIPPDSETGYTIESIRENLTKLLNRRWIESISFPGHDTTHIDLHGKRDTIRIHPVYAGGVFILLNAEPVIDPDPPSAFDV